MFFVFNDATLSVITIDEEPWLISSDIACALGYAKRTHVNSIYARHNDVITPDMTKLICHPSGGGPQETRIFNARACYLIGMLSRTGQGKAFRNWIAKVIDVKQSSPISRISGGNAIGN
ncbi:prophage antirepressor-like protein [Robbsia andropogonis]|uniref:BRO-N domain-containing protein n=1 Tax=Robbsia andropogonis TaxID=28092 RepID=UPI003D1D9665